MTEPVWIDLEVVLAIHDEQLAEHGGQPGVRDRGLLESAIGTTAEPVRLRRAINRASGRKLRFWTLPQSPVPGRKQAYQRWSSRNFFCDLNSFELIATDAQCVTTFLQLAAGDLTEDQLSDWISTHSAPIAGTLRAPPATESP